MRVIHLSFLYLKCIGVHRNKVILSSLNKVQYVLQSVLKMVNTENILLEIDGGIKLFIEKITFLNGLQRF